MTRKIADIKAKVGEYTNRDGQTKGRWVDVGYVLELGNGGKMRCYYPWINLSGIPKKDGQDSVVLSEFEIKDDRKPRQQESVQPGSNGMDDEIPF